jgi:hypothetical protein
VTAKLITVIRSIRIVLSVAFAVVAFVIVSVSLVAYALPPLGRTPIVVRNETNVRSISTGSLLIVGKLDPDTIATTDSVAYQTAEGDLMLGQVVAPPAHPRSGLSVTRYDAGSGEPVTISQAEILGRVEFALPVVGDAVSMLGSTGGAVSSLGVLGVLMLMIWLAEDAMASLRPSSRQVTALELAR